MDSLLLLKLQHLTQDLDNKDRRNLIIRDLSIREGFSSIRT
jgi:hypothetical protein